MNENRIFNQINQIYIEQICTLSNGGSIELMRQLQQEKILLIYEMESIRQREKLKRYILGLFMVSLSFLWLVL